VWEDISRLIIERYLGGREEKNPKFVVESVLRVAKVLGFAERQIRRILKMIYWVVVISPTPWSH